MKNWTRPPWLGQPLRSLVVWPWTTPSALGLSSTSVKWPSWPKHWALDSSSLTQLRFWV